MSGIAGVVHWHREPVKSHELEQMIVKLHHRGPHGRGIWLEGFCGLGNTLLWNTPESLQEKLPSTSAEGNLVITADVRLDNREELIEALEITNSHSWEVTDSDLILGAYQKWGQTCPQKLLGDFAFAIWDSRQEQLFCARDHFGCKPLIYYHSNGIFAFASEVKALFCLGDVPRRINEGRIADFLVMTLERIDKTSTFYENIFKLPPAHTLTINREKCSLECYWNLDSSKEIHYSSDQDYEDAFLEIFTEAVSCRLRSHSLVGSMLSGGMDSSSIVCIARELLLQKGELLHTFSGVSDDRQTCCESPFIEAILGLGGLNAEVIGADEVKSFLPDVHNLFTHTDDLFDFLLHGITLVTYSAAHRKGLHVMMTGLDGDLVVSQREIILRKFLRTGKFSRAYEEAQAMTKLKGLWGDNSPTKLLWNGGLKPLLPQIIKQSWRLLSSKKKNQADIQSSLISEEFARRVNLEERLETLSINLGKYKVLKTAREVHQNSLDVPNLTVALDRYERVAAFYSIEPRHPLLDKRLVEFCLSLPGEQKVRQGWTKSILRRAMVGKVPDSVRWRQDCDNVQPAFTKSMLRHQQEYLPDCIAECATELKDYVNVKELEKQYFQCYATETVNEDAGWKVWPTVTLAMWLRDHR